MQDVPSFEMEFLDYLTFGLYFVVLCAIGFWAGRKEKHNQEDYFLAGRSLPWYVVGGSFIASNISAEHFIGMIGAVFIFGIALASYEWGCLITFSFLLWIFIPFLLKARIFTVPEYMEKRFSPSTRHFFAFVPIVSNIFAFLTAVLYGGGLALHKLFGWDLWTSIIVLGVVAGSWAIYGGLKSVAWTDFMTVIVMFLGGTLVSILGLHMLSGDANSIIEGFKVMLERNAAKAGIWKEVVELNTPNMVQEDSYNRLSVMQPLSHEVAPWTLWVFSHFSLGFWFFVLNQFMVQRLLGAKNLYHARMGMVFAGYLKIFLPIIIVIPGLVLFARYPETMQLPWDE
ncbi:MAG: sodium/solute symporter, partial [Verrucomicrobiota bacterium]